MKRGKRLRVGGRSKTLAASDWCVGVCLSVLLSGPSNHCTGLPDRRQIGAKGPKMTTIRLCTRFWTILRQFLDIFLTHSGRKLLPTDYLIPFRENLSIPIPTRNYFELVSFTDTDSYPPSGIRPPKKLLICNSSD